MDILAPSSLPERLADAAEAALPSTSEQSIFPVTAAALADSRTGTGQTYGDSNAILLWSMAAVFLLSFVAAYLTYLRLMSSEQKRRERVTAGRVVSLPALMTNKKAALSKMSPVPGVPAADGGSKSAPETPEQVYTPKQVRSSSHDLSEVGAPALKPLPRTLVGSAGCSPLEVNHPITFGLTSTSAMDEPLVECSALWKSP